MVTSIMDDLLQKIFSRSLRGANYAVVHNLLNAEKYLTESDIYIFFTETICEHNLDGVN